MFPASRWPLRPPREFIRALSTKTNTPGPQQTTPTTLLPRHPEISRAERKGEPSKIEAVSAALKQTSDCENSSLTPVRISEDPHGVLKESHPAMSLLDNSSIVVQRQLEMMNVLMGFEQADRYVIMDPQSQSYWLSSRTSAWHRERLYMSNFSYPQELYDTWE
jgi:hypothetical protein